MALFRQSHGDCFANARTGAGEENLFHNLESGFASRDASRICSGIDSYFNCRPDARVSCEPYDVDLVSMFPLISVILVLLTALGLKRLLPVLRKQRRQSRFIRETLATSRRPDAHRISVSMSTVPDRINNLRPTIRSLLKQTRPPDEIVLVA